MEELTALVDKLKIKDDDHLIFVGDLIDKGPSSAPVLWYVLGLQAQGVPITLVEGNHEEKHRRFRRHERRTRGTSEKNPMMRADEMREITKQLDDEHIKFLEEAVLWHKIPHLEVLVVHGGIPLRMKELPSAESWRSIDNSRQKERAASLLRLRYEDHSGNFVTLGKERPSDTFWAERYDGRFGHVFFGHEPNVEEKAPKQFDHATGLDTGCVYGNALTAAVFWPGATEPVYVSVKARKRYYKRTGESEG